MAHPYSLALTMWQYLIVLQLARQEETCDRLATELIQLSREHHFPVMLGNGMFFMGWASAEAGDLEPGIALMEQGLGLLSSSGRRVLRPYMQTVLARAMRRLGGGLLRSSDEASVMLVERRGWTSHHFVSDFFSLHHGHR